MAINLTGISNENEFYTYHYLATILENDLKGLFATWEKQEEEQGTKPPYHTLGRLNREYFAVRGQLERLKTPADIIALQQRFFPYVLESLGYEFAPSIKEMDSGIPLPIIGEVCKKSGEPELWILEAVSSLTETDDPLDACLTKEQYFESNGEKLPLDITFADLITKHIFTQAEPPRWVLLVNFSSIVLLDRSKWNEKRFLRFDLAEILGRKETSTLKAVAALLHRDSICPEDGICLLDSLDENSHKHAFAVSEDLKYSAREAVELIGNEVVYYYREVLKEGLFGARGGEVLNEKQLTEECLRYLYRLLFLFYIEARPELGYAPMSSEEFRTGYSLESLRDLEMANLTTEESQNGYFINDSLKHLFRLIFDGFNYGEAELSLAFHDGPQHHTFRMQPLNCHLFDPARIKFINRVRFRNHVLQRVIQLLSLSRSGQGRRGRISYAQLGINQLGAVYEGLLSYSGFFAKTDLYEVKKPDEQYNELEAAYFVTREELTNYEDTEKVFNNDGTLKMYPKGTFIYRLAGRNREKSASYYTPEVLTQCLVKYALKELLKDKSADDILKLTVCEPAMGSGAFLNEAINQLAEAYLQKKQKETNQTIGHDVYALEKQKVRAFLADNNVYGVDLNPTAVELAEVSLWLNSICPGNGDTPTVPWFGNQLVTGNSLIGARRQVFAASNLEESRRGQQTWQDVVPKRVPLGTDRPKKSVYHYLVPDSNMADYGDKVVKAMVPEEIAKIKEWRKSILKPFTSGQSATLSRLSDAIDKLWNRHVSDCARIRQMTRDAYTFFGYDDRGTYTSRLSTQQKDELFNKILKSENVRNSSAYRRLKMVMDYWCALWFWPITDADKLPSRDEWLMELTAILEGGVYDIVPTNDAGQMFLVPEAAPPQQDFNFTADEFGYVNVDALCETFPRLALVKELGARYRFHHWELEFADLFSERGGFDLILGNPPWVKVEWNEGGILGDYEPLFALRKLSAPEMATRREEVFSSYCDSRQAYYNEYEGAIGIQNFLNGVQNYPLLKGMQTNLYKCFLPLSWHITSKRGVQGLLHPEGIYDDANGGKLRAAFYQRLRYHFQFQNQLMFFPIPHRERYSINIAGIEKGIDFDTIANLFSPITINASYSHDGSGIPPVIKNDNDEWDFTGHKNRIIHVNEQTLSVFASLYDVPGTQVQEARLPALHSLELLAVLRKFTRFSKRLGDLEGKYATTVMFDETNAPKAGSIRRETRFPSNASELIMSGPHFYVGNPCYKTPRRICTEKAHYDVLDLCSLSDDYLPRTNYVPACEQKQYEARITEVPWEEGGDHRKVTDFYRVVYRAMLPPPNERTLIGAILPPKVAHINGAQTTVFMNHQNLLSAALVGTALIGDFYVKSTGRSNLHHIWATLPLLDATPAASVRLLALNCLTSHYCDLWNQCWDVAFCNERWGKDDSRLDNCKFSNLKSTLERNFALRTDYERRQALVEIDVLAAMALELTLDELCSIYRIQFPVLRQNENDTWYDQNGHIVFTCSKGLPGVGFSRPNWNDIKDMKSGTVSRTITDDTMPSGPVERIITYTAPFDKCDREEDYRTVWAEFERRLGK